MTQCGGTLWIDGMPYMTNRDLGVVLEEIHVYFGWEFILVGFWVVAINSPYSRGCKQIMDRINK
ncbi:hypothetical protein BDV23DRAFT_155328 [Aspergillus alliaceus]|uniref:Uncharacterized protein n=1 Tax=Petromyces alliaceus TaxID=209559 RepID=A0A5N7C967_PETAA|nr:hypothetical protein BDV23DRAFT_155328 [Aspergillus alliaceus]